MDDILWGGDASNRDSMGGIDGGEIENGVISENTRTGKRIKIESCGSLFPFLSRSGLWKWFNKVDFIDNYWRLIRDSDRYCKTKRKWRIRR